MVLYERSGIAKALVSVAASIELVVSIVSVILVGIVLLPFGVALSWQMTAALAVARGSEF